MILRSTCFICSSSSRFFSLSLSDCIEIGKLSSVLWISRFVACSYSNVSTLSESSIFFMPGGSSFACLYSSFLAAWSANSALYLLRYAGTLPKFLCWTGVWSASGTASYLVSSPVKTYTSGSTGLLKPPTEPDLPPFNLVRFAAVNLLDEGGKRLLAPP